MQRNNEFTISGRLPSLNDYTRENRSHWSKGAQMKSAVEEHIMWEIRAARNAGTLHPVDVPVQVHIYWHESDMRRDADNIQSAQKFILDALQKGGILENDDRRHVPQISHDIVNDTRDYVRVLLIPIE